MDLWRFYDAPHLEDVSSPLVMADFIESDSTESVAFSSMFGTIALRAHGPSGGKVTFHALRSYLEPKEYERLRASLEKARAAGKLTEGRLPSDAALQKSL